MIREHFVAITGAEAGPLIAAVLLGLPAAAYAALRVIRRDSREDAAVGVVERSLGIVERDRDYWKDQAQAEREQAEERMRHEREQSEERLRDERQQSDERLQSLQKRMSAMERNSAAERRQLYRQIEDLRRQLQYYVFNPPTREGT